MILSHANFNEPNDYNEWLARKYLIEAKNVDEKVDELKDDSDDVVKTKK